jgi:hypothetical protein
VSALMDMGLELIRQTISIEASAGDEAIGLEAFHNVSRPETLHYAMASLDRVGLLGIVN